MTWHTFNRAAIDVFKAKWPCHGLPDNLNSLAFEFASNGDLVDIEAKARNGRRIDSAEFDGPELTALCRDARDILESAKGHDVGIDTLKCRRCGLFAFECVETPCDPGRVA